MKTQKEVIRLLYDRLSRIQDIPQEKIKGSTLIEETTYNSFISLRAIINQPTQPIKKHLDWSSTMTVGDLLDTFVFEDEKSKKKKDAGKKARKKKRQTLTAWGF